MSELNTQLVYDNTIIKRSVSVSGHATSISIESAFWNILKDIAKEEKKSINHIISQIDDSRSGNLSSALRVYVLKKIIGY